MVNSEVMEDKLLNAEYISFLEDNLAVFPVGYIISAKLALTISCSKLALYPDGSSVRWFTQTEVIQQLPFVWYEYTLY